MPGLTITFVKGPCGIVVPVEYEFMPERKSDGRTNCRWTNSKHWIEIHEMIKEATEDAVNAGKYSQLPTSKIIARGITAMGYNLEINGKYLDLNDRGVRFWSDDEEDEDGETEQSVSKYYITACIMQRSKSDEQDKRAIANHMNVSEDYFANLVFCPVHLSVTRDSLSRRKHNTNISRSVVVTNEDVSVPPGGYVSDRHSVEGSPRHSPSGVTPRSNEDDLNWNSMPKESYYEERDDENNDSDSGHFGFSHDGGEALREVRDPYAPDDDEELPDIDYTPMVIPTTSPVREISKSPRKRTTSGAGQPSRKRKDKAAKKKNSVFNALNTSLEKRPPSPPSSLASSSAKKRNSGNSKKLDAAKNSGPRHRASKNGDKEGRNRRTSTSTTSGKRKASTESPSPGRSRILSRDKENFPTTSTSGIGLADAQFGTSELRKEPDVGKTANRTPRSGASSPSKLFSPRKSADKVGSERRRFAKSRKTADVNIPALGGTSAPTSAYTSPSITPDVVITREKVPPALRRRRKRGELIIKQEKDPLTPTKTTNSQCGLAIDPEMPVLVREAIQDHVRGQTPPPIAPILRSQDRRRAVSTSTEVSLSFANTIPGPTTPSPVVATAVPMLASPSTPSDRSIAGSSSNQKKSRKAVSSPSSKKKSRKKVKKTDQLASKRAPDNSSKKTAESSKRDTLLNKSIERKKIMQNEVKKKKARAKSKLRSKSRTYSDLRKNIRPSPSQPTAVTTTQLGVLTPSAILIASNRSSVSYPVVSALEAIQINYGSDEDDEMNDEEVHSRSALYVNDSELEKLGDMLMQLDENPCVPQLTENDADSEDSEDLFSFDTAEETQQQQEETEIVPTPDSRSASPIAGPSTSPPNMPPPQARPPRTPKKRKTNDSAENQSILPRKVPAADPEQQEALRTIGIHRDPSQLPTLELAKNHHVLQAGLYLCHQLINEETTAEQLYKKLQITHTKQTDTLPPPPRPPSPDITLLCSVRKGAKKTTPSSTGLKIKQEGKGKKQVDTEDDEEAAVNHDIAIPALQELIRRNQDVETRKEQYSPQGDEYDLSQSSLCMTNLFDDYPERSRSCKRRAKRIQELTEADIERLFNDKVGSLHNMLNNRIRSQRLDLWRARKSPNGFSKMQELRNMNVVHPFTGTQGNHIITLLEREFVEDNNNSLQVGDFLNYVLLPEAAIRIYAEVNGRSYVQAELEMRNGPTGIELE